MCLLPRATLHSDSEQGWHGCWGVSAVLEGLSLSQSLTESGLTLTEECHWVRGVIKSGLSSSHGCHQVRGVIKSVVSSGQGCYWARILTASGLCFTEWAVSLSHESSRKKCFQIKGVIVLEGQQYHWVRGVVESGVSLNHRCFCVKGAIVSIVIESGCHWGRGVIKSEVS
jgi:hypothetical protein